MRMIIIAIFIYSGRDQVEGRQTGLDGLERLTLTDSICTDNRETYYIGDSVYYGYDDDDDDHFRRQKYVDLANCRRTGTGSDCEYRAAT
jgi:hypothetical protein